MRSTPIVAALLLLAGCVSSDPIDNCSPDCKGTECLDPKGPECPGGSATGSANPDSGSTRMDGATPAGEGGANTGSDSSATGGSSGHGDAQVDAHVDASQDASADADVFIPGGCLSDLQCTMPGAKACIENTGACVECTDDNKDACLDANKPACSDASHACVECTASDDGRCTTDSKVCDPATNLCELCLTNMQCTSITASRCTGVSGAKVCDACAVDGDCYHLTGLPACDNGTCTKCTDDNTTACTSSKPACREDTHQCVECSEADSSLCTGLKPHCGPAYSCVQCTEKSQCSDATKPICGSNSCRGCENDGECGPSLVCDEPSGKCVACTVDTEVAKCTNGNACHPTAFTCTGAPRGTLSTCVKCVSDSECASGQKCVSTNFNDAPHGSYCLLVAPESPTVCANQYAAKRTASSVLGVSGDFCFPNDTFTTCEAVLDFKDACTLDTQCGAAGLNDGLCKSNACTYGCNGARDCSGTDKCIGVGSKYCDPN